MVRRNVAFHQRPGRWAADIIVVVPILFHRCSLSVYLKEEAFSGAIVLQKQKQNSKKDRGEMAMLGIRDEPAYPGGDDAQDVVERGILRVSARST